MMMLLLGFAGGVSFCALAWLGATEPHDRTLDSRRRQS
jgi:hypothetical protein